MVQDLGHLDLFGKIKFIDYVNAIDIVNLNCFIDNLFCKKDDYNQDLHLNNLDLSILDINDFIII